MNYLCVICVKPSPVWLNFLSKIKNYKVVVLVDDNSVDCRAWPMCVQIPDHVCEAAGFVDTSFTVGKKVAGWDKALYYFAHRRCTNVWFLEEDVFVYDETTLMNIDAKYPKADLLTNTTSANLTGKATDWLWPHLSIRIPPPYYCAMCCAGRMSRPLLLAIKEYARTFRTLFFLEALVPTLCRATRLVHQCPPELREIHYRKEFAAGEINIAALYHPVKNMAQHSEFRRSWRRP